MAKEWGPSGEQSNVSDFFFGVLTLLILVIVGPIALAGIIFGGIIEGIKAIAKHRYW